ncbi:MAG: AMP-binding protein, partial [Planctomycetales bacterium]|nr:AMP-binding protein [Planctomycetales bacterium]
MTAIKIDPLPRCQSRASFSELGEVLRHWAGKRPAATAYSFLGDDDQTESRTYEQLDAAARRIAGRLQQTVQQGDRALLLFPAGLEFIEGFFGCLYAGVIPVPTCYPKINRPMPRLDSIARDTSAAALLSTEETLTQIDDATDQPAWAHLPRLAVDAIDDADCALWSLPALAPEDTAFLQYTSGSTSDSKGGVVSHGNLLANLEAIRRGFHMHVDADGAADSRGAFWLPAYHDMALIGGIVTPLYVGGQSFLMSPRLFLQRPLRWLDALSRTKANISGAPNFAFDLCVDKTTP